MTRLCPNCDYDLGNLATGGRCPECGQFGDWSRAAVRGRRIRRVLKAGGPYALAGLAVTFGVPCSTRYWGDTGLIPLVLIGLVVGACVGIVGLSWILHSLLVPTSGVVGKVLCAYAAVFIFGVTLVIGLFVGL